MNLRKLEIKDAALMLAWMHDESVTKYLQNTFAEKNIEDCRQFIKMSWTDIKHMHMAIVDKNDIYMGTVSLKHIEDNAAEFAIVLRPCAMGKGFGRYAMTEMIRAGFSDLRLDMIYWCVNPQNQRAVRFYAKNEYRRLDKAVIYTKLMKTGYTEGQIAEYDWYWIKNKDKS